LRKNLHITILSLFGGFYYFRSIPTNVIMVPKRYKRTDRRTILWHHRWVKIGKHNIADIIGIADILT